MDDHSFLILIDKIKDNAAFSDREALFPEKEFEWIKDAGLLGLPLCPSKMTYQDGQTDKLLRVLQKFGGASLPVGRIFEGHVNALQLIGLFGSAEQKASYFSEVLNNRLLLGVWNTQEAEGVRIHDLGGGNYRLQGCKNFCSGASWIQLPLITGRFVSKKRHGWQMCVIPQDQVKNVIADGTKWKPLGMRTSASYKMDFTGIMLHERDLLGPADAYYQQPYFSGGAIRFAAVQLGAAQSILEETHQFLKMSGRAGDAFQKARISELARLVETGNLWITKAAGLTDRWHNNADHQQALLAYINMTRTVVAEICTKCMELAERSVGVMSLMQPHPLERMHRDLSTYLKQAAPDAAVLSAGEYILDQQDISSLWPNPESVDGLS